MVRRNTTTFISILSSIVKDGIQDNTIEKLKELDGSQTSTNGFQLILNLTQYYLPNKRYYKQFEKLLTVLGMIIHKYIKNVNTTKSTMSTIRQSVLKKYGIDSPEYKKSLTFITLDEDQVKQVERETAERKVRVHSHVKRFHSQTLKDIIVRCSNSNNIYDWIIAVQLSMGCRLIEVLNPKVSKFTISNGKIIQIGVAKDKEARINSRESKREVVKPHIVLSADVSLSLINKIREDTNNSPNLTNSQLTVKYNHVLNKRIHKYLPNCTSHDLRRISANLAYHLYGQKLDMSYLQYIQKFLGHEVISEATISYSVIKIDDEPTDDESKEDKSTDNESTDDESKEEPIEKIPKRRIPLLQKFKMIDEKIEEYKDKPKITREFIKSLGVGTEIAKKYINYKKNNSED